MPEYIEREAIKVAVRKRLNNSLIISWLISIINEVPTADVAHVVSGRWKNITIAIVDTTGYCDVCGEQAVWRSRNKPYAICPNCGARMDGE